MKDFNFLQRNNYGWFLGVKMNGKQEITLTEIEQKLKEKQDAKSK